MHFLPPLFCFHTHSRRFLFVLLVGPCLQFAPFAGTCYGLYLLLVRATTCSHYWYVLWVVPIVGTCYRLYPLLGYTYNLHPLLGYATTCIHYRLYRLLVRVIGCSHYWDILTICTHYWDVLWLVSINFCF